MHSQLVVGSFSLHMLILHLYAPHMLSYTQWVACYRLVYKNSPPVLWKRSLSQEVLPSVIHIADMHSETYYTFLVWNSTQCTEGSQTYTPHTYLQGKKLFVTALWSRLMIVEMHWPRPYMGVCLDGLWMESTITCSQRMWTTRRK